MSNDQFFQIIKEYTEQIQRQKGDLSEILIDRGKMDQQEENKKPKIVVKEIDLSSIEEFNNICVNSWRRCWKCHSNCR